MTLVGPSTLASTPAPRFAVAGHIHPENPSGEVRHVGLLAESIQSLSAAQAELVHHMRPPMGWDDPLTVHAVGWIDLSHDEQEGIADLIEELRSEPHITNQYHVCPSLVEERDALTGRVRCRRFSCAGFVTFCYREGAGLRLLVDDGLLPLADKSLLERVWSSAQVSAGRRYGLTGAGPWTVLLPGYLLNAMRGERTALPYAPSLSDASVR